MHRPNNKPALAICIYILGRIIEGVALANTVFLVSGIVLIIFLFLIAFSLGGAKFHRMASCLLLILFSVVFWALYFQLFFALNLFVDRLLDRDLWGHVLPSPLFISLESIFLLILAPILGWLWQYLEKRNLNPTFSIKFALAMFFMAGALTFLTLGIHLSPIGLVSKFWVVISYLCVTLGELLISPICIAMVTMLSPQRFVGMMMGVYLAAIGFGAKLAGVIAALAAVPKSLHSPYIMSEIYSHAFIVYTQIAVVTGVIILLFTPFVNRLARNWLKK